MDWFNEVFDLAAVASGAGLAGGGGAAVVAWMIRGALLRFIVRTLVTAALTGVGFYVLLDVLGFQIVPQDEVAAARTAPRAEFGAASDSFLPQSAGPELAGAPPEKTEADERRIVVRSPFRRGG